MSSVVVRLFDEFSLTVDGQPVTTIQPGRQQTLLAYLVLHRDTPQLRRHLAFLFWPDSSEAQAHANLRHTLHHIRRSAPAVDQCLALVGRTVQWLPEQPSVIDVAEFDRYLAQAAEQGRDAAFMRAALEEAVDLYRGNLLAGCYDDWVLPERERWQEKYLATLERLIILLEEQRDYPAAIAQAQRLLRHDRLHEATYRRLMTLFAANGDRANALRTYHTCVAALECELGVQPQPGTQDLYAHLLDATAQPVPPPSPQAAADRLVGRQAEWNKLQALWRAALRGQPQFALVTGEAGIGKTRLVEEMLQWATRQGLAAARTRSYAAEGALAYAPLVDLLRSPPLQAVLPSLAPIWLAELARLLPELAAQHPPPPATHRSERLQRLHLYDALARAVGLVRQPLLLALDDLQWCDQESLQWLHYLMRAAAKAQLLVLGTARTSELSDSHPLSSLLVELRISQQLAEIDLSPLTAPETAELIALLAERPLAPAALHAISQASEGNPLFVVELMRDRLSRPSLLAHPGQVPQPAPATSSSTFTTLPPRLRAVIQSRLDLLSPGARDLAGIAATCGRAFEFALLTHSCEQDPDTVARNLDELWQRRLVREQASNAYDFSHDAIREVAYAAIGPARRRMLHARVAQAMEHVHAHDLDAVSAQLAAHYHQSGMAQQAISWYERAAGVAEARFDYARAVEYLDAALVLLAMLPPTNARNNLECTLLLTQTSNLLVIEGFTGPKMAKVSTRVEAIAGTLQDDRLRYLALRDLRWYACSVGAMDVAYQYSDALLHLALQFEETDYLVEAYNGLGVVCRYVGRLPQARQHLERAIELCPDGAPPSILANLSLTLWLLGYPLQACRTMDTALAAAHDLDSPFSGNPFDQNIVIFMASILYRHVRDADRVAELADRLIDLGERFDIRIAAIDGLISRGWVAAALGDFTSGIPCMRAGIDEYFAMNHRMFQPQRLVFLIDAQLRAHAFAAAAATLDEALALTERTGERGWDADLLRQKAALLAVTGAPASDILATYEQAVATARGQKARALELRATVGLCRFLHHLGRTAEASQRLTPLYAWFTQGHDMPDLVEAKTLLDTLSA